MLGLKIGSKTHFQCYLRKTGREIFSLIIKSDVRALSESKRLLEKQFSVYNSRGGVTATRAINVTHPSCSS